MAQRFERENLISTSISKGKHFAYGVLIKQSNYMGLILTCLLRNLYTGQKATVTTGHGTTDWFQIGKESIKAVYCHPAYLTSMQSTS